MKLQQIPSLVMCHCLRTQTTVGTERRCPPFLQPSQLPPFPPCPLPPPIYTKVKPSSPLTASSSPFFRCKHGGLQTTALDPTPLRRHRFLLRVRRLPGEAVVSDSATQAAEQAVDSPEPADPFRSLPCHGTGGPVCDAFSAVSPEGCKDKGVWAEG